MKVKVELENSITVQSGSLQKGYLSWSLYGKSPHQKVKIAYQTPPFQIREIGEQNYAGFIKLPSLSAGDQFLFKVTLEFSTYTLRTPLLNFRFESYPQTFITQYCRGMKFWETADPQLLEISTQLRTESGNDVLHYLQNSFDFVRAHIKFRENLNIRLGARRALKEGKGDCDEFSDLFITLCRIAKIPARRVIGLLLTGPESSSLHAWSEVYIPLLKQWVPFDAALNEFGSIKWNYMIRAHIGLHTMKPLIWFKSKAGKNFQAKFAENDVAQVSLML
ncbi:MAG: transglutaminase-like domain-containing protein [Candidatus Helarchaeota archaeon]